MVAFLFKAMLKCCCLVCYIVFFCIFMKMVDMKRKLLTIALSLAACFMFSQTTHNLDWFAGIGNSVDLTIEDGDTVVWTWTSPNHTVENSTGSAETFNSGFLGPTGSTFSHTFTVIGTNPYFCGIHGANSMSGTITVVDSLSSEDFKEQTSEVTILQNPITTLLTIKYPKLNTAIQLDVFNVLGKRVYTTNIANRNILTVDTNSWKSGVYLVKIATAQGSTIKRVVKL